MFLNNNSDWMTSTIKTANKLYSTNEFKNPKFHFYRGKKVVDVVEEHFKTVNKNEGRPFSNLNKWTPADMYMCDFDFDNTIIKTGVKIDDLVHIGHNSFLGDNSQITVGAIILGRAILGKNCWLSPGSVIDNGVEIGDNSLIGVNTHIRKNIESNCIVSGNPPRVIRKVKND